MTITLHRDLIQGSDEWLSARRGLITASEMKLLITPTLKVADNEKTRSHIFELAAQRISQYVEPSYVGDDMLRGMADEQDALNLYNENFAPVDRVGFITNDRFGFTMGYSPDGLVSDDGGIEVKGRRQKFHVQQVVEGKMPDDYLIQVQTGMMVSERKWIDFWSHCGGMPARPIRVFSDAVVQTAILDAAIIAEAKINATVMAYNNALKVGKWVETERRVEQEMFV